MDLRASDPEYMAAFERFARAELPDMPEWRIDGETRHMAILAALAGCQGAEAFGEALDAALEDGFSPEMAREIVYQATPYLGMGRVRPFLTAMNAAFARRNIALPLRDLSVATAENRLERGAQAQVEIFGEDMRDFWRGGPMNRCLAANCFGDYYTRGGLNLWQRELITFCFLYAQGGCEAQLSSHIRANLRMGNGAELLERVVGQCVPYVGYPRSLNALSCIRAVCSEAQ